MIRLLIIVTTCIGFWPNIAFSQPLAPSKFIPHDSRLGLISFAKIRVNDQATGNCWTNSNKIAANIRLKFEQNDIETLNYEPVTNNVIAPTVNISVIGLRAGKGICAGYASFSVTFLSFTTFGGSDNGNRFGLQYSATVFERGSLFVSGSNLNNQTDDFFEAYSSEFVAEVLSGRRNQVVIEMKSEYPNIFTKPMTVGEFETLLDSNKN